MKVRRFLLASAMILAATMVASAQPSLQTVPLDGAGSLTIEVRGDLVAVPDPMLKVVRIHARESGRAAALKGVVTHSGDALTVTLMGPSPALLPFAGGVGYAFEVHYPPGLPLRVLEFGGSVSVAHPRERVEIYDESGAIRVDDPRAVVTAQADAGNITVTHARTSIELTADSGTIDAALAPGWSGQIVRLESATGSIALHVPPAFRGRYDLSSMTGTIRNPLKSQAGAPLVFILTRAGNASIDVAGP